MEKLKLNIFKELYQACKTPVPAINFIIYSAFYWLEQQYIDYKVKSEIDVAEIRYHHELDRQEKDWKESAVITETKSETSTLLPELHISNPDIDYR